MSSISELLRIRSTVSAFSSNPTTDRPEPIPPSHVIRIPNITTVPPPGRINPPHDRDHDPRHPVRRGRQAPLPSLAHYWRHHKPHTVPGFFSLFGAKNPFVASCCSCETVLVQDTLAWPTKDPGRYKVDVQVNILESFNHSWKNWYTAEEIQRSPWLGIDWEELLGKEAAQERVMPVFAVARGGKCFMVNVGDKRFWSKATNWIGLSSTEVKIMIQPGEKPLITAEVPKNVVGCLEAEVFPVDHEGWIIVTDIENHLKPPFATVDKVLAVTVRMDLKPSPGMIDLLNHIQTSLPGATPCIYVTDVPNHMYPYYRGIVRRDLIPGPIFMLQEDPRYVSTLAMTIKHGLGLRKIEDLLKLRARLPKRKSILMGDSKASDPEAFGELARQFPDWVGLILIQKHKFADVRLDHKRNREARFVDAFEGIPKNKWFVYTDPAEARTLFDSMDW